MQFDDTYGKKWQVLTGTGSDYGSLVTHSMSLLCYDVNFQALGTIYGFQLAYLSLKYSGMDESLQMECEFSFIVFETVGPITF